CAASPGRSSRLGGGPSGSAPPPAPGTRTAVPGPGVALLAVDRPSCQDTTVLMVTRAGPAGWQPVTVSSVVVQAKPIAVDRLRRAAASSAARSPGCGCTS